MSGVAFSSSAPAVIAAWDAWQESHAVMVARRKALMDKYDRALMFRRDWDHGTRIVGFAKGDQPYDEKAFKVVNYSTLEPRMSTKAGKAVAAELAPLYEKGIKFDGMPQWFIDGNLRVNAPAIFEHEGAIWLRWPAEPNEGIDESLWTKQPLSAYYTAKEAHEATEVSA